MHSRTQRTIIRITNCVRLAAVVTLILTLPCLYLNAAAQQSQVAQKDIQSRDEQVRQILESLEQDNTLRFALERGDRGSGVYYAWMDKMRQQKVKQASFRIRFAWCPKNKRLDITDTKYLRQYYRFDTRIDHRSALKEIRESGLEQALTDEILIRAKANLTQRARDLRSNWICGTLYLNLLDDEILPILDEPAEISSKCENASNGPSNATRTARHSLCCDTRRKLIRYRARRRHHKLRIGRRYSSATIVKGQAHLFTCQSVKSTRHSPLRQLSRR
jgi:hypothetical protein